MNLPKLTLIALAVAGLGLAACNRQEEPTTGQRVEDAVSTAGKVEGAATTLGDKVADAAITAGVNAELARDSALSMLKIDVDTTNGHVVLRGQAPDAQARARATQLAQAVKGVTGVENQLELRS